MAAQFDYTGLDKPFEASWPVHVQVPQDGGTVEEQTFEAMFRLYQEPELEDGASPPPLSDEDFLRRVFIGLADPGSPSGEAFEALREKMLRRAYVRIAIFRAYNRFQAGQPAKN